MESNPYSSPSANLFSSSGITSAEAVSQVAITHLQRTKPWVRFMAVMCFIGSGFMLLGGAGMAVMQVIMPKVLQSPNAPKDVNPALMGGMMLGIAIFYAIVGIIYLFPGVKLWKYANRIASLMNSRTVSDLEAALDQQRSFWKFVGIAMIIGFCLGIVGYAVLIVTVVTKMPMPH